MTVKIIETTWSEVCEGLGISEYAERIWNAGGNDRSHVTHYVSLEHSAPKDPEKRKQFLSFFVPFFEAEVKQAEKYATNPDIIFTIVLVKFAGFLTEFGVPPKETKH